MRKLFFLVFFIAGCAPFDIFDIDSEFYPYLEKYLDHKEYYTGTRNYYGFSIIFNSLNGIDGRCTKFSSGKRVIEIDPEVWFTSSEKKKEIIFFHEMGHCDLNRHHIETDSLMRTYGISDTNFQSNETEYLEELFLLDPI